MSEAKRTAGPWRTDVDAECPRDILAPNGELIASAYRMVAQGGRTKDEQEAMGRANAEFIVRACNSFDDLLAAASMVCSLSLDSDEFPDAIYGLVMAVAKAEAR